MCTTADDLKIRCTKKYSYTYFTKEMNIKHIQNQYYSMHLKVKKLVRLMADN